jgi:SAM-dependent methyltransferase
MSRGPETEKNHTDRTVSGFYDRYMKGTGLDVGYRGGLAQAEPVLPGALGVDLDYPGYDGRTLPFEAESVDYVYSSHVLEHVSDWSNFIRECYRVTKLNGFIIIIVPHQYLYERKWRLPSRWNGDHKRFYTPHSLLKEVEYSLPPNTYRVRSLRDVDSFYDYKKPLGEHPTGSYEIELVLEKIEAPEWTFIC